MLKVLEIVLLKKLKLILHSKWFYLFLICITFIYSIIFLSFPKVSKIDISNNFIGFITNYKISGNLLTIEIDGVEKIIGYYYFNTKEEMESFENIYNLGDSVVLIGNYVKPSNNVIPNLFNYKRYLENKKIYYLMEIDNISKLRNNTNIFYTIKNKIINHIDNYQSSSYLHAFILGNNDLIDKDVINSYQENGISHLLAISGMHISLFSSIILLLLKKLNIKENKCYLITVSFLVFYMMLSGNGPSVCRSVLLFSLLSINRLLKLEIKTINLFILVFCFLVLINPNILFDVGFQFSFTISFYLILLNNKLNNDSYIKSLFKISLISFLVGLPISIYYFYQINILSIIFNLFFVPYVSFIIFPLSLITLFLPFLDEVLLFLISIMENVSVLFNSIEFSKIIITKPSLIWILVYYLFLTIFLLKNNKICLCLLIMLLVFQYFNTILFPKMYLIMIDVGQGDSMLIHNNNKTILVDTGGKINYQKEESKKRKTKILTDTTLVPLFKSLGIKKLDYLVLTHGDFDHMGEAINLVNNFKVEKVIFNCGEFNDLEQELIKVLDKKKVPYYSCIKELNIDDNKLYFLNNEIYDNENDNSSVIYTELNNYKFLFMGDAGIEVEKDLIEKYNLQDIDVLKVGHHGSRTSTSKEFIDEVNPEYSIISVGNNNRYGHPNDSVLDNLEDSKIYRTDQDGSIMFKINKDKLKMETCTP